MSDKKEHAISVASGKYTFINRGACRVDILRYGERWVEDGDGPNAIATMMAELDAARVVLRAARALSVKLERAADSAFAFVANSESGQALLGAVKLQEALVDDRELPSAWCGAEVEALPVRRALAPSPTAYDPVEVVSPLPTSYDPVEVVSTAPTAYDPVEVVSPLPTSHNPIDVVSPLPTSYNPVEVASTAPTARNPVEVVSPLPTSYNPVEVVSTAPTSYNPVEVVSTAPTSYNPVEVERLVHEAREDDARMLGGTWQPQGDGSILEIKSTLLHPDGDPIGVAEDLRAEDALGIAHTRNNLRAMADQLEAARTVIAALTAQVDQTDPQCPIGTALTRAGLGGCPAEVARLISETREDDARMTSTPWLGDERSGVVFGDVNHREGAITVAQTQCEAKVDDAEAIARTRNNLRALADQLEAAHTTIVSLTAQARR